jgi:very-short-patch-repair endonuclease
VTTPERTLRDLRGRQRERAASEAQRLRLIGPELAGRLLPEGRPAANRLERRLLRLCRDHGLPRPVCQATIGPYTVDFLWPAQFLVVETDGHDAHGTRLAFEEDRARDAELATRGYRVLRFTWRQLSERGGWVAGTLQAALTV